MQGQNGHLNGTETKIVKSICLILLIVCVQLLRDFQD